MYIVHMIAIYVSRQSNMLHYIWIFSVASIDWLDLFQFRRISLHGPDKTDDRLHLISFEAQVENNVEAPLYLSRLVCPTFSFFFQFWLSDLVADILSLSPPSKLSSLPSTLSSLPSTLSSPPSTLSSPHSTLSFPPSTLLSLPSTGAGLYSLS